MKFLPSQLMYFFPRMSKKRNIRLLIKFLVILIAIITIYSLLFHFIMDYEGQRHSWITGFYWTLTVMSTLGFGDITFTSDMGRIFSVIVLLSGIVFLLIMLPFTFIQFFYAPWLEAQAEAKTPRNLPIHTSGHVILTNTDPISINLIKMLTQHNFNYAIVVPDQRQALELYDMNYKVVVGELDIPETYKLLQTEKAALVFVNNNDMLNTNITSTIRGLFVSVPIVTNAEADDSIDILRLAGATHVFQFTKMLGRTLARRAFGVSTQANIIGKFGNLIIAEASVARSIFENKTIVETKLREMTGINIVGIWQRGKFKTPFPHTSLSFNTILVLAGTEDQLKKYDELVSASYCFIAPVLILGGGRVGRAVADELAKRDIQYRIVEKNKHFIEDEEKYILGNAADFNILLKAGIHEAPTVFITTHDDDINIYLTIYCRRLRPDIQIISRATHDRNIDTLHNAGADLVISYASLGANIIFNILKPNEVLMFAEGLNIFRMITPASLIGKSLQDTKIREISGCSVVAITSNNMMEVNPDPTVKLSRNDELILIGAPEAEEKFTKYFSA